MRKVLTGAQRLDLLLPWLNDPTDPYTASPERVRRWSVQFAGAIGRFLVSFDGSPAAGHVEVPRASRSGQPRWLRAEKPPSPWRFGMDPDALLGLQVELDMLLAVGFSGPDVFGPGGGGTFPMSSLRFGVRNTQRPDVKLSTLTRRERQTYTAPGAYVLQVSGTTHDLVLYLVLHLLTAEDMAGMLARCQAPAPNDWKARCNKWFIRTGHGRKKEYCAKACRTRNHAEKNAELEQGSQRGRKKR